MPPAERPSELDDSNHVGRILTRALGYEMGELWTICMEALSRYKLRTALSILGVVLGVGGVIAVMSVGQGARDEILRQVELLGLENIVVRDNNIGSGDRLTLRDSERLIRLIPSLSNHTPLVDRFALVFGPATSRVARVVGITSDYRDILHLETSNGRFLSDLDDSSMTRVTVLGERLASDLFGIEDPLGQSVRVSGEWYRVVGVLGERSMESTSSSLTWRDLNDAALVPLSTLLARPLRSAPSTPIHELWLQLRDGERVLDVGRIVEQTLPRLTTSGGSFEVIVPRALMDQRLRTQRTFSVVVGSMATLTLIVGGIGIMNNMLASVLERTQEIGLRRTVGATRRDITMQFLAEALLMTLAGGAAGIALGGLISLAIASYAGWAIRISLLSILLALVVSIATGLAFGIYPAMKAARLPPIDALRYE